MNAIQSGCPSAPAVDAVASRPVASAFAATARSADRQRSVAEPRTRRQRSGMAWLGVATATLAVLAIAAAVVSWEAQYVMVVRARHTMLIAALEAGIPDAGAAVFAALGIALALHGRRALRPRVLNLACIGLSLAMNAMAAEPGWRAAAIWVMPAAVYALASDTLIAVVRAHAIARMRSTGDVLAEDDATPLAVAGHVLLWLLRVAVAPASTLAGFRRWLIEETPVAPRQPTAGRSLPQPRGDQLPPHCKSALSLGSAKGKPGKQSLLISLAAQRYDLRTVPLRQVAAIASAIAGDVGLHPGTARRVLRAHVLAQQVDAASAGPRSGSAPQPATWTSGDEPTTPGTSGVRPAAG